MTLIQDINNNLVNALKKRDEVASSTLKLLKSAVKNKEIALGKELEDKQIQEVVASQIKQRRDSIDQYTQGGRNELADKEQAELDLLLKYLPQQLTELEIIKLVDDAINMSKAQNPQDMGKVMAVLMSQVKGKADGTLVSKIVRNKLS